MPWFWFWKRERGRWEWRKKRVSAPILKIFKYWSFRGGINLFYLRLKFMSMQINQLLFLHNVDFSRERRGKRFELWWKNQNREMNIFWHVERCYVVIIRCRITCKKSKCFICLKLKASTSTNHSIVSIFLQRTRVLIL